MSPPQRTERRRVALVGLAEVHSGLLRKSLLGRFEVEAFSGSLLDVEDPALRDAVIVAGDQGVPGAIHDATQRLRTERFIWNPVILLLPQVTHESRGPHQWAVWVHRLPPDIAALGELIEAVTPLAEDRQREVVRAALIGLWEDLLHIRRAAKGQTRLDDTTLRSIIRETRKLVSVDAKAKTLLSVCILLEKMDSLENAPALELDTLRAFGAAIVEADTAARQPETGLSDRVRAQLHRLSNAVRFAIWNRSLGDRVGRLQAVLSNLPIEAAEELTPGIGNVLSRLGNQLSAALHVVPQGQMPRSPEQLFDAVEASVNEIKELTALFADMRGGEPSTYSGEVKRILVVEDEIFWRDAITGVLESMNLPVPVEPVADAAAARKALSSSDTGTLALMDIALPPTAGQAAKGIIDPDAGLKLIREFSESDSGCKFIVLTGFENYSDAVRTALQAGVDPWDYIQKDPDRWEEQLRSRVQVALAPRPRRPPRVQVFKCTGRLVTVDGVEVALERKPYAVFEYLADRQWHTLDWMRVNLAELTPSGHRELSDAHIHDYIYDIRRTVEDAFRRVGRGRDLPHLIVFDESYHAYRLEATVEVYDHFEDLPRRRLRYAVLVVEDDSKWNSAIVEELSSYGFAVQSAQTAEEAQRIAEETPPDVVSLDLQLPKDESELAAGHAHEANGVAVLRFLKARFPEVRIAVLTAIAWKDAVMLDILREGVALADYISKQWQSPLQRLVRSLWRLSLEAERGSRIPDEEDTPRLHQIEIDPEQPDVFRLDRKEVRLSRGPAKVFRVLAISPNAPVNREILIDAMWTPDELPDDFEGALNTLVARVGREISKATGGKVTGRELIRSKDGVYWLHGIIKRQGSETLAQE